MRRLQALALILTLSLLLPACGTSDPPPPAAEVLSAMLSAMEDTAQPLPDGVLRLTAASADSPEHLTETFFSALYGEAARGLLGEGAAPSPPITDAALFLSLSPYPCELACFRCADESAARTVAGLCRGRLDTLSQGYAESEWAGVAAGGRVAVEGSYVLLALCEDPASVLAFARRFLS